MPHCPECGSNEVTRIGLYEFECDNCCEIFDINECSQRDIDNFEDPDDYPRDDDDRDY